MTPSVQELPVCFTGQQVTTQTGQASPNSSMRQPASLIKPLQQPQVGLLTWTKNDPSIKKAMDEISDTEWFKSLANQESDPKSHIIKQQANQESDQKKEETYYLLISGSKLIDGV